MLFKTQILPVYHLRKTKRPLSSFLHSFIHLDIADSVIYLKLSHSGDSSKLLTLASRGGTTIGAEGGVKHPPPFSNISVFTVLTPHLPMHWTPNLKCVAPPMLISTRTEFQRDTQNNKKEQGRQWETTSYVKKFPTQYGHRTKNMSWDTKGQSI